MCNENLRNSPAQLVHNTETSIKVALPKSFHLYKSWETLHNWCRLKQHTRQCDSEKMCTKTSVSQPALWQTNSYHNPNGIWFQNWTIQNAQTNYGNCPVRGFVAWHAKKAGRYWKELITFFSISDFQPVWPGSQKYLKAGC